MQETSSFLLVSQTCSLTVAVSLCLLLIMSRFLQPDTTRVYENTRILLIIAMLILSLHYILQISCGFRAHGDDVGAAINILFYSPVSHILSYSIVRIGCGRSYYRRHIFASVLSYLLVVCCFVTGYFYYGSLHMKWANYAMGIVFFCTIMYFSHYSSRELRRVSKKVDDESGETPVQYNMYMRTSSMLLNLAVLIIPVCIFYTPTIALAGVPFFIALLFYTISFIGLGFNINRLSKLINEETSDKSRQPADSKDNARRKEEMQDILTEEDKTTIGNALVKWRQSRGYSQSDINSATLALRLKIQQRTLVHYLRVVEGKTFRVWLSDLRIEEAKLLMKERPEYSNEAIAEACGFTRNYLQSRFKDVTGFTPSEWRDLNSQNTSAS